MFLDYNWKEMNELLLSAAVLGFAFSAVFSEASGTFGFLLEYSFWYSFVFISLASAFSLWLKTSLQKYTARVMESYIKYSYWVPGMIISFLSSFLGVLFTAVGGVEISTEYAERFGRWKVNLTTQQMGLLSTLGIMLYLGIGMVFYLVAGMVSAGSYTPFMDIARLNAFLAVFSLFPVDVMDGAKVMRWKWELWSVVLALSVLVLALFTGLL